MRFPWRRRRQASPKIGFFVVGTGRCGTTLVRDILRRHPNVYVPVAESHWIPYHHEVCGSRRHPVSFHTEIVERFSFHSELLMTDVMAMDMHASRAELFAATRAALGRDAVTAVEFNDALFGVLAAAADRSVIGDKTPCYCLSMPLLQRLWPDAKFVHIFRDGRDVALSMSRHPGFQRMVRLMSPSYGPLALDRGYARPDTLNREPSLEDFMELWAVRLGRALDDARRLRRASYLDVRYESLVGDPRAETIRLARFLDVPQPEEWLTAVEQMVQAGNTNKVTDRAVWQALTAVGRESLARLNYPT